MNIFLIKGSASSDGYRTSGVIYTDMEEKPASYVGKGTRINKKWIKEVHEGKFHGSFQMFVTELRDVPYARAKVKEAVEEYNIKLFEKYKAALYGLDDHSLLEELKWRNQNGDPVTRLKEEKLWTLHSTSDS